MSNVIRVSLRRPFRELNGELTPHIVQALIPISSIGHIEARKDVPGCIIYIRSTVFDQELYVEEMLAELEERIS